MGDNEIHAISGSHTRASTCCRQVHKGDKGIQSILKLRASGDSEQNHESLLMLCCRAHSIQQQGLFTGQVTVVSAVHKGR